MTPDQATCDGAIRQRTVDVIPHLGRIRAQDPNDRAYAESLGLTRFVVDA